jgi:enamine deaminase RidA (YjgF/YER057c/UK114 family)
VSGTTGFDYATMSIPEDVVGQVRQCLCNIDAALTEAGGSRDDIVRVRYILPVAEDFERCWPDLRQYFRRALPAATMICADLMDSRVKIEIEVTALRQHDSG